MNNRRPRSRQTRNTDVQSFPLPLFVHGTALTPPPRGSAMPLISELLQRLPMVKDVHMSSAGLALWICWEGDLDPSVPQSLQDYGGMSVVAGRDQSIWYFFSPDVFLALARLSIWAKFNPLPVSVEVIPARLLLSVRREMSIAIDGALSHQEILIPQALQIWVHPKAREQAGTMPGITFVPGTQLQGMASQGWEHLEADARLPYSSSQGWYALLRPLGNPLDKRFQAGWRFMYSGIEELIQRHKLKFTIHDNFVMMPLENLRQLRTWMRDLLQYLGSTKGQPDYWPCVCVIIDRRGLNFNNELPQKVGIKWSNLMPDFPYMSYRNAFLLGDGFQITDLHFSSAHSSMDSWCTVAVGEGKLQKDGSIPVLVAGQLILGDKAGCFYCGARGHDSVDCPTRRIKCISGDVWKDFGTFPLDSINEGFRVIETTLEQSGIAGYAALMDENTSQGRLMLTIFEINLPLQLRIIERLWQTTGRDFPSGSADMILSGTDMVAKDDSPVWGLLERFSKLHAADLAAFEKDVQATVARVPRDHRLRALLGFSAMERGDLTRAQTCWREAETIASSSLHQGWYMLLMGRLLEMQGRFSEASDVYQGVLRLCPQWQAVEYRQVVCRVKMGFTEQIQPRIHQMVEQDSQIFNRFLIDPELERGHLLILTMLYPYWADSKRLAEEEKTRVEELLKQVDDWFPAEHLVARKIRQRLVNLAEQISIANYLAFLGVVRTRPSIEKDLAIQIQQEIEDLKGRFKNYLSILEVVRDEAAWFPFPRVLVEFNRDFNECAGIINWAFGSNFHEAESFKRAQGYVPSIVELLTKLEKRLKFLRVVRDSTLFVLILGRTFFWLEVIGLILCIIGIPTIAVFGNEFGMGWLKTLIRNNHWELQKVLLAILSVLALGIAALRTTLVFEKRRDQLVSDARAQREEMQRVRLERIKESVRLKEERGRNKGPVHPPFAGPASLASAPAERVTLRDEEE